MFASQAESIDHSGGGQWQDIFQGVAEPKPLGDWAVVRRLRFASDWDSNGLLYLLGTELGAATERDSILETKSL